jgi:AP-1 complex subunit beta-1
MVQLQLLTAVVKMFLKQPENTSDLVQRVLQMATAESDNPDLRDRGFVYWRLLSSNPDAAKAVVLAEKPVIADDSYSLDSGLLTGLIGQLATLASVYHKPPEAFVTKSLARLETQDMDEDDDADYNYEVDAEASTPQDAAPAAAAPVDLLDMGGMDDALPSPPPAQNGGNLMDDMMGGGGGGGAPPSGTMPVPKCLVVNNEQGQGVEVSACFSNASGNLTMDFEYANNSQQPMTTFAIQFDKNSMGLVPGNQQIEFATPLNPMTRAVSSIPISADPNSVSTTPPEASVKAATKNMATGQVVYFACPVYVHTLLSPNGSMEKQDFLGTWKGVNDQFESQSMISDIRVNTVDSVKGRFAAHSIFHVASRPKGDQEVGYFCGKTINGWTLLFELTFKAGVNACKLCIKSDPPQVAALAQPSIEFLLKN